MPPGSLQTDNHQFHIRLLPSIYAVSQLPGDSPIPDWAAGEFVSATVTRQETTVVCHAESVPADVRSVGGWRCLHVDAVMDFSIIGVIASLSTTLANAGVSVFVCSTFDTDYILVNGEEIERACRALEGSGHHIHRDSAAD